MTEQLSCHAWNFIAIASQQLEEEEFSTEYELW